MTVRRKKFVRGGFVVFNMVSAVLVYSGIMTSFVYPFCAIALAYIAWEPCLYRPWTHSRSSRLACEVPPVALKGRVLWLISA